MTLTKIAQWTVLRWTIIQLPPDESDELIMGNFKGF